MPLPIKSLNDQNMNSSILDMPEMSTLGLSDLQIQLFGFTQTESREASRISDRQLIMLKQIDANVNEVVTAANQVANIKDSKVCSVPQDITDHDLLSLKTAGLISGYGRSVTLTDRAKLALRDHYLSQETVNEFKKSRTKNKFNLEEARSVKASDKPRFVKVASWLTDDEFRDEFDVRFVANTNATRQKGLMFAEPLGEYEVVFFDFPDEDQHSFWNNNVDFSLSLAFLDNKNVILDFKDLKEQDKKLVSPKSNKVKYVVEAKHGVFDKLGIKIGDKLILKDKKLILRKK